MKIIKNIILKIKAILESIWCIDWFKIMDKMIIIWKWNNHFDLRVKLHKDKTTES